MYSLFNVYKEPNQFFVENSFETYFENKNDINLMNLLKNSLAYSLCFLPLESVNLEFVDLNELGIQGKFQNGTISINENYLKNADHDEVIPLVFNAMFHELCHAVLIDRNLQIVEHRALSELFVPQYDLKTMYGVFYGMTKNKELSYAASNYFYYKNPNEIIAYNKGSSMAQQFLDYFAKDKHFYVKPGQENINREMARLIKKYPFLIEKEDYLLNLIEKYQLNLLSKGIKNLTFNEKCLFVQTTFVNLSKNTRYALLNECYNAKDELIMATMVSNPALVLSSREKQILSKVYDRDLIEETCFSKTEIQR